MKKNVEKIIPKSNYIKLLLLIGLVVFGVFVFKNYYSSNEEYEKGIPVIRDAIINEINSKEIYNYIRENNDAIIYVGVSSNKLCRSYEEVFKTIINKYHLEEDITYLNLSDLKGTSSFMKEFNKFYDSKLKDYPSIIIFNEGKVKDILTIKNEDNMKSITINFLLENEIPLNEGD